jgi:hypothetical protein
MAKKPAQTSDIDEPIGEQIKRELQEGDLVKITLKENAILSSGIYHAIVSDETGKQKNSGQYCCGFVGYIDQLAISLRETWNVPNNGAKLDVYYSAIESFKKAGL